MKKKLAFIAFTGFCHSMAIAQLDNKTIHDLKAGRVTDDTSHVYWLPWQPHESYLLVQGWQSSFSHKGELALDFKMKAGTIVCAAREGVVTSAREDSDRGGAKPEYMNDGNHVIIRHSDGSYAAYWHLQKDGVMVTEGDSVRKGQQIGLSGNTGYSAFPHLHFEVYNNNGQMPVRFYTKKGSRYLRPGKFYRSVQAAY